MRELDGLGMRCAELLEYGGGGSGSGLGWHWDVGSTLTLVAMLNTSTQARGRPLPRPLPCPPSDSHSPYGKPARTTRALGGPQQASSAALARHSHHTCTTLGRQAGGELQLSTNCSVFRVPLQRGDVAVGPPYDPHCVDALTSSSHTPYARFCRCTALVTGTA